MNNVQLSNVLFYSGRETRDVGDLQKELKAAKDNYEVLSSNIEPLKAQAEQFSQHASEDHKKATDADEVTAYLITEYAFRAFIS